MLDEMLGKNALETVFRISGGHTSPCWSNVFVIVNKMDCPREHEFFEALETFLHVEFS